MKKLYKFYDDLAVPLINQSEDKNFRDQGNQVFLYSLWFHDVIYEPQSKTNEKDSADLFL
jgi:predicted metal-dependent HD superfamily phosphohydrolase